MEGNGMRRAVLVCLLAGGLAGARHARGGPVGGGLQGSAGGDDFTLNVPVVVSAIGAASGRVSCRVLASVPPAAPAPVAGVGVLGMGAENFTLTNGAFKGTVTVRFGVGAGKKPEDARGYQCSLNFLTSGGEEKMASSLSHKQGTPYVDDIRGAIKP